MNKLYLDACVLNRLTDDQSQPRIRKESEAIEKILGLIEKKKIRWVSGVIVEAEIRRNPEISRREDATMLLSFADSTRGFPSPLTISRAALLERSGYGAFDALHLAFAEQMGVDALLTTDDRFIKLASRGVGFPAVPVQNPIIWLAGRGP